MGRRVLKVVSPWNGTAYANPVSTRFVYDGWNLLAELDADNGNAVKCSYMWGLDLSGSLQGAGGVGGLLTVSPGGTTTHFVSYDGNGNVAALTDSTGNISARYEYDPFGQTIRASGAAAGLNQVRFSSKYTDPESGSISYLFRSYTPATGRWSSRDPIGEKGGINLYGFVMNAPVDFVDPFGWKKFKIPQELKDCCTDGDVTAGEAELLRKYKAAEQELLSRNIPRGQFPSKYSCIQTSSKVITALIPYPKCWSCYLERRYYHWWAPDGLNHQVVICESFSKTGNDKELIFDYWGNNFGTDVSRFRKIPYLKDQYSVPYLTGCDGRPLTPPEWGPPPSPQWDKWE